MSKKNNLITTSAIISLMLFNANTVNAETEKISTPETQTSEVQKETTVVEEPVDADLSQNNTQEVEKLVESLNVTLNDEQKLALEKLISNYSEELEEAFLLHRNEEFEETSVIYEQILQENLIDEKNEDFIRMLLEATVNKENIFDDAFESENKEEDTNVPELGDIKGEKGDRVLAENSEAVSESSIGDTANEFPKSSIEDKEVEQPKNIQHTKAVAMNIFEEKTQSRRATADELYHSIMNAKYAFQAWDKALEFEAFYPEDSRLQEALDTAAIYMLNQAIKSHENKDYAQATSTYQKLLSNVNISPKIYNLVKGLNAQSSNSADFRSADDLYDSIMNARFAYQAWDDAIYFKRIYPNDDRLTESVNRAAGYILKQGIKSHQNKNYNQAVNIYSKLLNESLVKDEIRKQTIFLQSQAMNAQKPLTADELYDSVVNAKYAYQAWDDALLFKDIYQNDSRVDTAINTAARYLLNQGVKSHRRKDYTQAINVYSKILSNDSINYSLYETTTAYLNQAEKGQELITADDLYNSVKNAKFAYVAWDEALYMNDYFSSDPRIQKTMDTAAGYILRQAIKSHQRGEFTKAKDVYEKILVERTVSANIYEKARIFSEQAKDNQNLVLADELYDSIMNAKFAYQAWDEALLMNKYYGNDSRTNRAINQAATYMLNQGIKSHQRRDYAKAAEVYGKIMSEKTVGAHILEEAQAYYKQAIENKKLRTAEDVHYTIMNAKYAYQAWDEAQYFKEAFPNNRLFKESMDTAATYILNQAIKNHTQNKFQTAMASYAQVYNETKVSNHIRVRAESYHYLASNSYSLSNIIFRESFYNISIDDFLNVQMTKNPQIWDPKNSNGKLWRSATRTETSRYIDPSRAHHNQEYLQFLRLSGSSGISVHDLNKELSNAGILAGLGSVFQRASEEANVNELYLIAHALLETGNGTSNLATGIKVNGRTVYNMFGIGAIDKDADKYGSEKAYEMGWFTPEEAIIGGAKWISSLYINNPVYKQDTLYKMRWNPANPGVHQYATDIAWAYNQTSTLNSLVELAQKYDTLLNFDVPKFK